METRVTHTLAEFLAGLSYEDLPDPVQARVKELLLDSMACAIAGRHSDETTQIGAVAAAIGGSAESTVLGGSPASLAGATLLNGYQTTAMTLCDVHRPTLCHVTPEVIPPALAVAEQRDVMGADLLVAIAAGLETTVRVGLGLNYPAFRAKGWHSPGVTGPFGGAAAVGKLLGLDARTMRNALGLAGSQSAGTFAAWGTPTIKFHQARGALSGLLAGLLAAQDFRSSDEILAHPDGGLLSTYSDGGTPDAVIANLGEDWELQNISLRLWPAASSIQSLITALFVLIERHDLKPEDIDQVRIGLSKTVYDMHGTLGWENKFRALLSVRYATAVVLHDRQCGLAQFAPDRVSDPRLDAFARDRVEVNVDSSLSGVEATVEVLMNDGTCHSERRSVPKGDSADPLGWSELVQKFREACDGVLPAAVGEEVPEMVAGLHSRKSVRDLFALLGGDSAGRRA